MRATPVGAVADVVPPDVLPSPCRRQQMTNYTLIENGMPTREISESFVQTVHTAGIGAGVFLGLLWSVKGDKITPTEHYITPVRAAYLKTQRGDDKNFCTESHGLELAKNEGAIGRMYITTALQGLRDLVRSYLPQLLGTQDDSHGRELVRSCDS